MTEHYTRNTFEVSVWCNKCRKDTPHRVLGGKLAYCIPCFKKSEEVSAAEKNAPAKPTQGSLW